MKMASHAALLAAGVLAAMPAAAQRSSYDGSYEYAAPGWRGLLEVSTADDGTTYFAINTRRDGMRCDLFGTGRLSENTITLGDPGGSGSLILRFFEDNAEIEASGSTADFCDAGAQLAGIYIQTEDTVTFDRDDVRKIQGQLNKLGHDAGTVDGLMGQRTSSALAAFQRQANLPETGELTLETAYRLDQQVNRATSAAAGMPAGTGSIAPTDEAEIEWLRHVPRPQIPVLDRLYSQEVPARIDWANPPFEVAILDLDQEPSAGRDQDEILVFWNDANFCGDQGCTFEVLKARDGTYEPVLQT
ncbi:MAG TPA: peptidoglycan-binding domain-containing protein, partial [Alphaproteobacteria bacterium]|nr:peptidoglycan-binding domain-containing protein [Alphaproteobacteria bacterium]